MLMGWKWKILAICLAVWVPLSICGSAAAQAASDSPTGVNMVQNGDFSDDKTNWFLYLESGGAVNSFAVQEGEILLDIQNMGVVEHAVQLYYDGFKLETGGLYRFAFDARSNIDRKISARLQLNGGDYHAYIEEYVALTPQTRHFAFEFLMWDNPDPAPRIAFNLGAPLDGTVYPPNQVIFDNVEVTLVDGSNILRPVAEAERTQINVNQVGYAPHAQKIAVLRGDQHGDTFQVLDESGQVALEGPLTGPIQSASSGETNYLADFSALDREGTYTVASGDALPSYPFVIGQGVYDGAFDAVFKMFYLQRCGSSLVPALAGDFAHGACHTQLATVHRGTEQADVSGGWHDAGDYGRYVSPGATAVADLLLAWEDFGPSLGRDDLGIPESGNGVPDLLDEARYELEWMLKMQAQDGGVYHKVTGLNFPGAVMPTEETEPLYLMKPSTTATASFAAVMAMSHTAYLPYDKAFAETCLAAAERAWERLGDKEFRGTFRNPKDVLTGEYSDGKDTDERCWAAVALYRATGKQEYLTAFEERLASLKRVPYGYGWDNVGDFANRLYLSLDEAVTDGASVQRIKDDIASRAEEMLALSLGDGYGSSLGMVYPWGSNMTVCNNAMHLLYAGRLLDRGDFVSAALRHYHYLLGANPMATCYVTGFGAYSPNSTHHRPSMALGKTMPGMLVGGPNSNLEDPYARAVLAEAPPAKAYVDNAQSYSCNEVTIYWNAPLLYLMAYMMH